MNLRKSNRAINKIIVHSTATPEGRDVDAATITRWHKNRGWSTIGYHYVIKLDGTIEEGRSVHDVGAHAKGHNRRSIGVVYVGGCDEDLQPKDTRNEAQDTALTVLLKALHELYPSATIHGHNEFANKACPSFDVKEEYGWITDGSLVSEQEIEEIINNEEEQEEDE